MQLRSFRPKIFRNNKQSGGDNSRPQTQPPLKKTHGVLKLIPIGGVGDVQKNMYVYEYEDDIVIIDCGVAFPDQDTPGVDLVIPDITYLRDKKSKIKGIIITHAHDDHIGALPYLWPELDVPIYSQKLTCGMIKAKFDEHNLPKDKIKTLTLKDTLKLGVFDVSFYQVAHSVPDSTGIVLRTPVGTLIHQADFKIDWTPVNGQTTDLTTVAKVGSEGVLLMTIDCLRVEKQGYNLSEKVIEPTFEKVEEETKGKVLITMTSSNITRIQQAINVAVRAGRKLAMSGRSMESNFQVARDLGYLDVPSGLVIPQEEVKRYPDNKVMVIIAGAFGQPGSSLSRAANNDHKFIQIKKDDAVVFSADPIPSIEIDQSSLIDLLTKLGCSVYYSAMLSDLHISGHAASEELKIMLNLAKPKYILPIGGNYRHMKSFSRLAYDLGYREDQVFLTFDGQAIEMNGGVAKTGQSIEISNVYVDGLGVGDVGNVVLRDRQVMSGDGIVVVLVSVNRNNGKLMGEPEMVSRGFVYEKESEDLLEAAKEIVKSCLSDHEKLEDRRYIRHHIQENLERFFYEETKRRPMIVTMVVDL